MSKLNRRLALLALGAAVFSLSTGAEARSRAIASPRPGPSVRTRSWSTPQYRASAHRRLNAGRERVLKDTRRLWLSRTTRRRLQLNLDHAVHMLRSRIDFLGRDGRIDGADHYDIQLYHRSLQQELRRQHGSIHSFRLL